MSASLVGSEMCIRDSTEPALEPPRKLRTSPLSLSDSESVRTATHNTQRELRGSILRPFLGLRGLSSERLQRCCLFCSSISERWLFGVNIGRLCAFLW
eukprot:15435677-Alexandrium_andersonii.AAC.1